VNIVFKVRISDEEIVDLLNRATVMIYTPFLEPFGFAPLEANACGTPVVAIAEGGVRETIQQGINGYLISNDDPVAIGTALTKLLKNPELARQMGVISEQYVRENWTWTTAVERLENYFFQLCNEKKLVKKRLSPQRQ
jgi:glycosyltransferase involved in cell wall biosynthesis